MVRVAAELEEALASILQAGPPDAALLGRLIDSYRDIARELGQQGDVERALCELPPAVRSTLSSPAARSSLAAVRPAALTSRHTRHGAGAHDGRGRTARAHLTHSV